MKRRDLLKLIGLGGAAVATASVVPSVQAAKPEEVKAPEPNTRSAQDPHELVQRIKHELRLCTMPPECATIHLHQSDFDAIRALATIPALGKGDYLFNVRVVVSHRSHITWYRYNSQARSVSPWSQAGPCMDEEMSMVDLEPGEKK